MIELTGLSDWRKLSHVTYWNNSQIPKGVTFRFNANGDDVIMSGTMTREDEPNVNYVITTENENGFIASIIKGDWLGEYHFTWTERKPSHLELLNCIYMMEADLSLFT